MSTPQTVPHNVQSRLRMVLFLITLTALLGASGLNVHSGEVVQSEPSAIVATAPPSSTGTNTPNTPLKITIPSIQVDAVIESSGLTTNGELSTPKIFTSTAWYLSGAIPWEPGNAVINGHTGILGGEVGAFDQLHTVAVWDTITVIGQNSTTTFVVRKLRIYEKNATATDVFVPPDTGTYLNLITCHGIWNNRMKDYPERLVVFATLVSSEDQVAQ